MTIRSRFAPTITLAWTSRIPLRILIISMKTSSLSLPMFAIVAVLSMACSLPAYSQTAPADLDRDGIPNISDPDVDNDGLLNGADRNIDGGTARSGPAEW
jgi:hypothetical protein